MERKVKSDEQEYLESWLQIEKEAENIKGSYLGQNGDRMTLLGDMDSTLQNRRRVMQRALKMEQDDRRRTFGGPGGFKINKKPPKPPKADKLNFLNKKNKTEGNFYQNYDQKVKGLDLYKLG